MSILITCAILSGVLCLMWRELLYDGVDNAKRSRQYNAPKVVVLCLANGVVCAVRTWGLDARRLAIRSDCCLPIIIACSQLEW